MSSGVITFSYMFSIPDAIEDELSVMTNRLLPVQLLMYINPLLYVISKGSRTSKKRTILDIAAAREVFLDKGISDIGFVRSGKNVSDGLTKSIIQAILRREVFSGQFEVKTDQSIVRSGERA